MKILDLEKPCEDHFLILSDKASRNFSVYHKYGYKIWFYWEFSGK